MKSRIVSGGANTRQMKFQDALLDKNNGFPQKKYTGEDDEEEEIGTINTEQLKGLLMRN